ncbi:MAG: V-type ATP synthase subunit K [Oligosphaeraceae bacterium]|mgnify:CR=1 FL=1|nr:V-type ATP synthase subunit K [Oligosphaeraceae bacterium]
MSESIQQALVYLGAFATFGLSAFGSVYGCGVAAASAIGSWKKCYAQGKAAPFQLSILTGVPMSQTIYGMILMGEVLKIQVAYWPTALLIGFLGGLAIGYSAAYQGRAAAGACDALAETGKGFVNYLIVLGIVETIAIFVLAFAMMFMGNAGILK